MGHSQLHLQNKFEWYLLCENQFYLREKKQCLPNQDFELTLILKNMGQLCQDDDCKESWEGPSAFPWRNSFSTISSPKKMERMGTSLRAPAGVGQGVHGGSLPTTNRWVIC